MSVHQKSLEMNKSMEHVEEAPELEYRAVSHDSLSMFLAAIGGAVLGMLLTLLVLAIVNGGTLSFTGGERLSVFEAKLARVDENLNSVNQNVNIISAQANAIQTQLVTVEDTLRAEMGEQTADMEQIGQAVTTLETTRAQFDTFMTALSNALSEIEGTTGADSPAP